MDPQNTLPDNNPLPGKRISAIFLNQRGLRAGWRLLIFCALVFVMFVVSGALVFVVSTTLGATAGPVSPGGQLLAEVAFFLATLVATWLMARIEGRKLGDYGLPLRRAAAAGFVRGYLLWGFIPLTLLLLTLRALQVFNFGTVALHQFQIFYWAAVWGLVFLFVALAEEYLCRGYALFTLADGLGFWPAAIILAALFAYLHAPNHGETRIGIIGVGFFAMFASATIRRTGNLWLAVGAHAGWDWAQSYFYGVSDSGLQVEGHLLEPHISGPDWLTGGSAGPEGSVLTLALLVVMTAVFLVVYRRKGSDPAADSADSR